MRERIYSDGMMIKQTWVFNFQCFSLCYSITPFWNFWGPQNRHGIFWRLIFGPGIFWGFAGSPKDFLGLDFWLHSIISVTRNPDYPPGPVVHNLSREKEQLALKLKKPMQVFMRWSATKCHIHLERYCKPLQKFMFLNLCFDWQVKVSFIDGSIKTYLVYVRLLWQIYLSFMIFECIWLCSADKILLHIITYSWLSYNSLYNLIIAKLFNGTQWQFL